MQFSSKIQLRVFIFIFMRDERKDLLGARCMAFVVKFGLAFCAATSLSLPSVGLCQAGGSFSGDHTKLVSAIPAKWELSQNDNAKGAVAANKRSTADPMAVTTSAVRLDDDASAETGAHFDRPTPEILYLAGNVNLAAGDSQVGAEIAAIFTPNLGAVGQLAAAAQYNGHIFSADSPTAMAMNGAASAAGSEASKPAAEVIGSMALASSGPFSAVAVARAPAVGLPSAAASSWLSTNIEETVRAAPALGTGGEVAARLVK